jgi:hypothetical protein
VDNRANEDRLLRMWGLRFVLPPRSLGVQSYLGPLTGSLLLRQRPATGYPLLVLDPPWQSKSVRRSKRYDCFEHTSALPLLPVPELADKGGAYVCVWITNDPSIRRFLFLSLSFSLPVSSPALRIRMRIHLHTLPHAHTLYHKGAQTHTHTYTNTYT